MTRFVCPECCPKGIPEGLPRGDARGATRGTYSSSDIPPILDRMLFSPSEVGTVSIFLGISLGLRPREIPRKILTVPPSDGENISFHSSPWSYMETLDERPDPKTNVNPIMVNRVPIGKACLPYEIIRV